MTARSLKLGTLVNIRTGKLDANASSIDGIYPFFTCSREPLRISSYSFDCECVLVAGNGDLNVKYYNGKFDAYQRTYIIESKNKEILDAKYLYHFMDRYLIKLRHQSIGGVIKYIKLGNLTEALIPIPSVAEQRRIANILDKAESLRTKRREVIAKLDQLLQSVFLEMFGDPIRNDKNWQRVALGDLLSSIDSGKSPVCLDRKAKENEWGVLKLGAVTKCRYIASENKALPEDEIPDSRHEVQKGDLLFSRKNTRELVAACAIVRETPEKLLLPDLIFRLVIKKEERISPIYLHSLLTYPTKRKEVQSLAGGAAGSMPNISKAKLSELLVELPSIEFQKKYESIANSIEKLRKKNLDSLLEIEKLIQSIQSKFFSI